MCAACKSKAAEIAALAAFFREKAGETRILAYIEVMLQTARELEALARSYAEISRRTCPNCDSSATPPTAGDCRFATPAEIRLAA